MLPAGGLGAVGGGALAVSRAIQQLLAGYSNGCYTLVPGMPVSAKIHLGTRSVLEYLFSPFQVELPQQPLQCKPVL